MIGGPHEIHARDRIGQPLGFGVVEEGSFWAFKFLRLLIIIGLVSHPRAELDVSLPVESEEV